MKDSKSIIGFFCLTIILLFCFFVEKPVTADTIQIPSYIKNTFRLWIDDHASDSDFLNALVELGKIGLVSTSNSTTYQNVYYLPKHGETTFAKIIGKTGDYGQTSPVILVITDPNGKNAEYTTPVLETGAYSTIVPINHDSPLGVYTVHAYQAKKELTVTHFYLKLEPQIPSWLKNPAKWLLQDEISDSDFILLLQYLVNAKIINIETINVDQGSVLDLSVNGYKMIRRGTPQTLDIHVSNLHGSVSGATVFVRVEDYGQNVLKEFNGITDSDGNYTISWELSKDFTDIETFLVFVDVTDGISSKTSQFSFQVYCLCGEPSCKCH